MSKKAASKGGKPPTDETPGDGASPARFEEALGELEQLVESLEKGDLSLEESLAQFERGVALARECRDALASAERKVQILLEREGEEGSLAEFDPDAGDQ